VLGLIAWVARARRSRRLPLGGRRT
jgi:hypothetical protein